MVGKGRQGFSYFRDRRIGRHLDTVGPRVPLRVTRVVTKIHSRN